ncbi:MAG TPA: multicopper oxidase domain-containing protein [candidate division Zixibacteria bacterium]|nr:multicopper oxidase domain-containing protein [candidate division Zixibacteria bacterium]
MQRAFAYFAAFTGMGVLFVGTLLLAALILDAPRGETAGGTASPQATASAPSGPIGTIEIRAFDLGFTPAEITVSQPGLYTVKFVNEGGTLHDVTFEDGTKIEAQGRQEATGQVDVPPEGLSFLCSVPGHADGGMRGNVVVSSEHASHQPSASAAPTMTAEQMRDIDEAVTKQFPAETEGRGNRIVEPEILPDGTKQWELTASVIQWETEPGTVVEAYAYNGMVPGPQLRAQVGDRIRIILHNELPEPTTLHSHGLFVPPEMDGVPVISQPAIMPGESFTYEYTLRNAGSHMYHSHFMAEHQVPMGLLGAFVVTDPNADDPEVDQDIAMILNDGPLGFTINGKGFPATEPIVARQGALIRIRYMNEGLQIHPMHLHGIPQLVVAKDGWTLPEPHYEDTVLVAPGERIDVLVEATEVGTWAFHCHILTHAEGPEGMFGMVTALIVQP